MKKKITQHNSVHFDYNHGVDFCFHMIAGYSLCDSFVSDASQVRCKKQKIIKKKTTIRKEVNMK